MSTFEDELRESIKAIGNRAAATDLVQRSLETSRGLRRRRTTATAGVIAVAVAALAIGGWAVGPGRHSGSIQPIVTPTPSATASANPTPTVSPTPIASSITSTVEIVYCPTSIGIAGAAPTKPSGPVEDSVTLPSALVGKVQEFREYPSSYGTNQLGKPEQWIVLGPKGWHCSAAIGANGSSGLVVAPQLSSDGEAPGNSYIYVGSTGRSRADLSACPYFLPVSTGAGFGSPQYPACSAPASQVQEKLDEHTIAVVNPPTAQNPFWLLGTLHYVSTEDLSTNSCLLPTDMVDICTLTLGAAGPAATELARSAEAAQLQPEYRLPMLSGAPATYTISGAGCVPKSTVKVVVESSGQDAQPLMNATADANGYFSIPVGIPDMKTTTVDLIASCPSSNTPGPVQVDIALRYVSMASAATSPAS